MSKKGYRQTKEHISKRMKGAYKGWFKKGVTMRSGCKLTEETKRKIGLMSSITRRGKRHSEETKEKIRKSLQKEKIELNCRYCRKRFEVIPSLKDKRRYCSKRCHGKVLKLSLRGKNNPSWLGGLSYEPYTQDFNKKLKEEIKKRDGFRCRQCFRHQNELRTKTSKPSVLSVHHIDFNKKNNNPDNLISLCRNCHQQTNFNRNDWIKYFQERLSIG